MGANYNNAGSDPDSTISNWLILPEMDFRNGDEFAFWTRTADELWADRLELRLSTNGPSVDVGSTATSTGDFETRLLVVNEDLVPGEYPVTWTRHSLFLAGLPEGAVTNGRLAFRYYVNDSGPTGSNGDHIGIDTVSWFSYQPAITVSSTVGTDPGVCGTSANLALEVGTEYYLCHQLTNDGNVPLTSASFSGAGRAGGSIDADLAVGDTHEWITGPYTADADTTLTFNWTAGNPERNGDPLSASTTASVSIKVLNLAVTGDELPDASVAAGAQDIELSTFTLAATGDSAVSVSGFTFSAADLAFSADPAAGQDLNRVLELLSLSVAGSPLTSTAAFTGSDVVMTLAAPLVIEPGSPVTVTLRADATASLSAEIAVATLAAAGLATLALRRRPRLLAAMLLLLLIGLTACGGQSADPEAEPVTVSFTTQLEAVASDAGEISGLPLVGASVTINY